MKEASIRPHENNSSGYSDTGKRSLSDREAIVSKGAGKKESSVQVIMPYMYILNCADGTYYTGSTWNLEVRLWEHQQGQGSNYTKHRLPVKLVYCEEYERIDDAFYREKQVQGWSRTKKKALIEERMDELPQFAKKIFIKK
jgi:putative endonuclease